MTGNKKLDAAGLINGGILFLLTLVMLYPFWYIIVGSVSSTAHIYSGKFLLIPDQLDLQAYIVMLSNNRVIRSFFNSLFVTIAGTSLSMTLTFMGAYVLSKKYLPGRTCFTFFLVFTMLFDGGMIPFYLLVSDLGLVNTIWSLIIPGCISTYNLIIMRNFLSSIPVTLEEAAQIDGAGHLVIMFKVYLPLAKAVLATVGLFYAVGYWNSFFWATIFLNDSTYWTLQVVLRELVLMANAAAIDSANGNMVTENAKMALIVITSVPIILVYPFLQKHFVKGVMIGSVKG